MLMHFQQPTWGQKEFEDRKSFHSFKRYKNSISESKQRISNCVWKPLDESFSPPFLTSFLAFFYSAGSDFQGCQDRFSTSVILTAALSKNQSSCSEILASLFSLLEASSAPRLLHIAVIHSSCWGDFPLCWETARSWRQVLIFPALPEPPFGGCPQVVSGHSKGWQGRASTDGLAQGTRHYHGDRDIKP